MIQNEPRASKTANGLAHFPSKQELLSAQGKDQPMSQEPSLTDPQAKALTFLREQQPVSPRQFAQLMWPESPAWRQRTNKRGGRAGAVGGTMPMQGARMLWSLHRLGLAARNDDGTWRAR